MFRRGPSRWKAPPAATTAAVATPYSAPLVPLDQKISRSFTWNISQPADTEAYPPDEVFLAGVRHHHICNTAYPIAHKNTMMEYRVPRHRDQKAIREAMAGAYGHLKEMMLYAHIPFCEQRCQFCEYTVVPPSVGTRQDAQSAYFDALLWELNAYADLLGTDTKSLIGYDIGGGTPSLASIPNLARLVETIHRRFKVAANVEASIETTPKIAATNPEKLAAYLSMGIRRISMGVQTTDFREAKAVGREDANSSVQTLHRAVDNVRRAGYNSFNIDLMYGFPLGRRERERGSHDLEGDTFLKTVQDTINLGPEHITLYRMRYKGTKMAHLASRVSLAQVNCQEAAARKMLEAAGYHGSIGKNTYSRIPGNSGCSDYLDRRVRLAVPYLGVGLGAQSFSHHTLAYNLGAATKRLYQYMRSVELERLPIQDLYHLPWRHAVGKMVSVSFYYGGIDLTAFKAAFGKELVEAFPAEVDYVLQKGLMQREGDRLQMTQEGKRCFGGVVSLFYAPSVQKHIIELDKKYGEEPSEAFKLQYKWDNQTIAPHRNTTDSAPTRAPLPGYEFGNILFAGRCNQKCPFCIGQQLNPALSPSNLRDWPLKNLDAFIEKMTASHTKRVIFTGTVTDPQLYRHEEELLHLVRRRIPGAHVSLHTNGVLALNKMSIFNQYDTATVSFNSFRPNIFEKLHGSSHMPDLAEIMRRATIPVKLSCILTEHNMDEVDEYIRKASAMGVKRIAFRHVLYLPSTPTADKPAPPAAPGRADHKNPLLWGPFSKLRPVRIHCDNPVFDVHGVEVTYWVFDKTSGKSLNLFADGTLSEEYLLQNAPRAEMKAQC